MDQDATACIQPRLDKGVGRRKILQQVFILAVVDLDFEILKRIRQGFLGPHAQHRDYMGDVGFAQSNLVPEREDSG
jgi:hypothetical protein